MQLLANDFLFQFLHSSNLFAWDLSSLWVKYTSTKRRLYWIIPILYKPRNTLNDKHTYLLNSSHCFILCYAIFFVFFSVQKSNKSLKQQQFDHIIQQKQLLNLIQNHQNVLQIFGDKQVDRMAWYRQFKTVQLLSEKKIYFANFFFVFKNQREKHNQK